MILGGERIFRKSNYEPENREKKVTKNEEQREKTREKQNKTKPQIQANK